MNLNTFLIQTTGIITFLIILNMMLISTFEKILKYALYFYIIVCSLIVVIKLGNLSTPLFLIGSSLIIFKSRDISRIWNLILFQVTWFWSVITDYAVTIPLRFLGYDFDAIRSSLTLSIIFILIHALIAILPVRIVNKWLRIKFEEFQIVISMQTQHLLLGEASICSCIYLLNIMAGSIVNYPDEILLFNGLLLFCFLIANFLIFVALYRTFQENKRLALKAQEQEILRSYMEKLESHYQDMRRFKHDYMNILATMTCYIQENDMEKLKHYFEQHIAPSSRLLVNNDAIISKLSNIKVLEVKGLLYTKLVQAMNQNLNISLELTQKITSINMNSSVLSLILGIFLDNAIEAAAMTEQRTLHIALVKKDNRIIFHLENSTLPLTCPLGQLCEPGVTTKKDHNGLGLCTAKELLAAMPDVQFYMTCDDGKIKQVLTIPD